jgi:threonylcarbamoyladenosine tRNA methylthiotransferase MtaB
MSDQCKPQIIKERKAALEITAKSLALAYKKQFIGKTVNVLVETERDPKTNTLCGYTERYVKVLFDGSDRIKNTLVAVRIEEAAPSSAMGTLL